MRWNYLTDKAPPLPLPIADNRPLLQGDIVLHQRCMIHEQVPAEGIGAAYLAFDVVTHQPVMVRVLPLRDQVLDATIAYARHDIRRVGSAVRPDIVKTYDIDGADNRILLATELPGISLAQRLRERRLTLDEALTSGLHIASALHYLHSHSVTFGILTPATIDMTAAHAARLNGIGLTHIVAALAGTYPSDIVQRASYVAPEEQRGFTPNPTTDIYHFGALLCEIMYGSPPPDRSPITSLPEATQVPPALRAIIIQCLQPQADHRPMQLTQVINEISAARRTLRGNESGSHNIPRTLERPKPASGQVPLFPHPSAAPFATTQPLVADQTMPTSESDPHSHVAVEWLPTEPTMPVHHQTKRLFTLYPHRSIAHVAALLATCLKRVRMITLRRRTVGSIALVTIVAVIGGVYGTGIFHSTAAPIVTAAQSDVTVRSTLTTLLPRPTPYRITQMLTLNTDQTLQLLPGVTLAFAPGTGIILQGGTLDASGTASSHVLLTSVDDPAVGGTGIHVRAWAGIQSRTANGGTGGRMVLGNVTIRFAGSATTAAIDCQAGALTLTDSDQSDSAGVGLMAGPACWGEVTRNSFVRDGDRAAIISNNALNFHDNIVLGSTITLPA